MSQLHRTTMQPAKLDLVAQWLPQQPWYVRGPAGLRLERAGGFRLDDPAGEVGVEYLFVTDTAHPDAPGYAVPLAYRGAPSDAPAAALLGTSEHGVLGKRWIYDAAFDPVAVAQLLLLVQGLAEPQAQTVSDTPDPTVTAGCALDGRVDAHGSRVTSSDAVGTTVVVDATDTAEPQGRQLVLALRRLLAPGHSDETAVGHVEASWVTPGGEPARGWVVTLH